MTEEGFPSEFYRISTAWDLLWDLYRSTEIKRLNKECDRDLDSEGDRNPTHYPFV